MTSKNSTLAGIALVLLIAVAGVYAYDYILHRPILVDVSVKRAWTGEYEITDMWIRPGDVGTGSIWVWLPWAWEKATGREVAVEATVSGPGTYGQNQIPVSIGLGGSGKVTHQFSLKTGQSYFVTVNIVDSAGRVEATESGTVTVGERP